MGGPEVSKKFFSVVDGRAQPSRRDRDRSGARGEHVADEKIALHALRPLLRSLVHHPISGILPYAAADNVGRARCMGVASGAE